MSALLTNLSRYIILALRDVLALLGLGAKGDELSFFLLFNFSGL